jgi:hypothetical protein
LWVRKIPDRELEEPLSSSGREKKKILRKRTCSEECGCVSCGIRAGIFFAFCSREEEKFTMPPREKDNHLIQRIGRCEEEAGQVGNPEMERQMRDLRARLEEMETTQRRTASAGDLSDSESEVEAEREEEVAAEGCSK